MNDDKVLAAVDDLSSSFLLLASIDRRSSLRVSSGAVTRVSRRPELNASRFPSSS